MTTGWRYRLVAALGTLSLTIIAVVVANATLIQELFAQIPYFGRPAPAVLSGQEFWVALWTTVAVVSASMWPLFKPRPRRILDTGLLTARRVFLSTIGLAALGYFNYTYRLPRSTLMLVTGMLMVSLPILMVAIRRRPRAQSQAVIIGDDPEAMAAVRGAYDREVVGYVTPPTTHDDPTAAELDDLPIVGGFARLDEVFLEYDVDTVLLAFHRTDRDEFFGTLEACYQHGITALVHRDHVDHVLTSGVAGEALLRVDIEPWDWQDYAVKRAFDIVFAGGALVCLSPIMALITAAIKLDSPGPVLYSQQRTATFGETFTVYKFRSMVEDAESTTGATVSDDDAGGEDPRVTRVGRFLRETHLDEIPQLWSILVGDMSVVGPRPERPELDEDMERGAGQWRRRWFVKPGLTGLAQIRGATGHEPGAKLRHDIEYIRRQSFWFDLNIVAWQVWQVFHDVFSFSTGDKYGPETDTSCSASEPPPVDDEPAFEQTDESEENDIEGIRPPK
ncbi:sugar transferase [Halovenus marina]|uniref:sugar transferase n=1 Tax=Halovenus marina TaxID=3396621 RepID=UPI003F57AFD1